MTVEIESKAWVEDPDALRKELEKRFHFRTSYVKDDTYYTFPGQERSFRIRKQGKENIVTIKKKFRSNGMEENLEKEFTVSDFDIFCELVEEIGCELFVRKKKSTEIFVSGNTTIELSFVESLGWFLEIEELVDADNNDERSEAKLRITRLIEELGIPREKIENRYYTELLTGIPETTNQGGPV